jgi:hypothetical protein
MSWLDKTFAKTYNTIMSAGTTLPPENALNFVSGAIAVDNAASGRTDVTIGGTFTNLILTGVVNNNATLTILGNDAKSKPQTQTGNIATSTVSSSTFTLYTVAVGEIYTVDAIVQVNVGSPTATIIAAWKLTGLYYGAAGPAATLSGTVLSQVVGGGAGVFGTAPTLVVSGANIQLQVTSPDTTARTWSWEAHVLRGLL